VIRVHYRKCWMQQGQVKNRVFHVDM
jgi:hypothetical protein